MSFKLTKTIQRPSDGQDVEYDGRLPEKLDFITRKSIDFTDDDIATAYQEGKLDGENRTFLHNVLAESSTGDASRISVTNDCREYMDKLLRGLKPGEDRFMRMQKLGFKHCVGPEGSRSRTGLDLSNYGNLLDVDLHNAMIDGSLRMECTHVRGAVDLICARIGGGVYQSRIMVGSDIDLRGAEINGDVDQGYARVSGHIYRGNATIYGRLGQTGARVKGERILKEGEEYNPQWLAA